MAIKEIFKVECQEDNFMVVVTLFLI